VVVAGAALRCIRDERLYLAAGWGDFGSYCQEKWEMHRETVDRMLRCAEVARVLEEAGKKLPRSEYALRVLAPLVVKPIGLIEVWERAAAASPDGMPTGAILDRIIRTGSPDRIIDAAPVPDPVEPVAPEDMPLGIPAVSAAPDAPEEIDWDAFIRGEIAPAGSSGGSGGGGGGADMTDAQRISRMMRAFGQIASVSERLRDMARGLGPELAEDDRAIELDAAARGASAAFEEACEAVQGWYSGDEAGLPEPEITEADFPEPFKFS
jgi:hypothetical protein